MARLGKVSWAANGRRKSNMSTFRPSGKTEKTPYGVNEIGTPEYQREGGGFERIDRWTNGSG
jgi:hypothetical protein